MKITYHVHLQITYQYAQFSKRLEG